MTIPVTAMTAAILALMLIFLAIQVVKHRLRTQTAFGDTDDEKFKMARGAHANLSEHTPLALIMMGALELASANHSALMALAALLITARMLHAYGMRYHLTAQNPRFRQAGVLLTWLTMIIMALWIIYICVTVNL